MSERTITLTGRRPIKIEEDNWTVIAKASDSEHDGQVECQANRKSAWCIRVREHDDDGRVIVSAVYDYTSNWQNARCYHVKHGVYLKDKPSFERIVEAIREVCESMRDSEHNGEDAARWNELKRECIADLPAEAV